jgi:hypothetical protein
MVGKKAILGVVIVVLLGLLRTSGVARASETVNARASEATEQVGALTPLSLQLVDGAISSLSQGWSGMSQAERDTFLHLYDPAGTGEVDALYVVEVLGNYRKIRATLAANVEVVYAGQSAICTDQRLLYTDLSRLYVCPFFFEQENDARKARNLIHEMAHIALLVVDRPYYVPTSEQYAELTPNGSWITDVPLVGRVAREVLRSDTLYHPDAYAHFALLNAGYTYVCLDV